MLPALPTGMHSQSGASPRAVHHFEGGRLLALEPVGVEGVDQGDGVALGHVADDGQGPVEVALHRQHLGTVEKRLGQLPLGHIAVGNQHEGPHAPPAGIGGRGGRGVAGAGADHRFGARFLRLAEGHGHAPVLEGAGGVEAVVLEEHLHAPAHPLGDHRCRDQGGGPLPQGDHRGGVADGQPGTVGLDQPRPVLHGGLSAQTPQGS